MRAKEEDKRRTAFSLHQSGIIEHKKGNYEEAEMFYSKSLEIFEELGDKPGIASSFHQLGMIRQEKGD
jgi:hypothetical protein